MKQRLGEDVPQELLDEIAAEEAKIAADLEKQEEVKQERKQAFKNVFGDLSSQLKQLMAEEKKKTEEEQALLDRFANVMSRVDEIKAQLVERSDQTTEEFIEEIIPQTVEMIPEEIVETTSIILAPEEPPVEPPIKDPIKDVAKNIKVTKPPSAFVQPDPPPVSRDIKDIQNKLKLLEGWVSKISMTGPGGGAVWLRDLDDIARSSVINATDGQVLTYNDAIKKWTAQDPTATASTTVEKIFAYVTNDDSVTIHKGDPVYLYRATGNRPSVIQAKSTSDAYSAKTLGLASEDIAPGTPGWVQTQGILTGVDTSAYAEGDTLYLSPTAGVMTNVKPYAPQHLVYMGVVVRANQGQGQIYIRPQNGYELDEIHDVNINHNVALANGHTIVWNASNSLWENRSLSGLVGTYTANNTNFVGTVSAANVVSNSQLSSNLANYQTTAGLSANVATLTSNNTLYLGGFAANQYAYANSLSVYQTTAGLSSNVATLTANNTSFVGTVSAANVVSNSQLSSNLANYQTTAGLSANVATLSSNNSLYLGAKAANQYAYANGSNFSINNSITLTYAGATPTGYPLIVAASNTQGGSGYADFLKVTNGTAGATANNKSFRLNSTGTIEIINSAYTATVLSLSDTGGLSVLGPISISGKQAVNGPAFSAYANNTLQTITSGSQQKVLFQVEEFDTNNNYASSRFTPTVEGYYQLNAEVRLDGASGTGEMMIILYKNGSEYKRGTNQSGTQIATSFWAMQVSSVVYANGTSDYFEIYVQQGSGGSVTVTAVNNSAITWFNGCMLRGG